MCVEGGGRKIANLDDPKQKDLVARYTGYNYDKKGNVDTVRAEKDFVP